MIDPKIDYVLKMFFTEKMKSLVLSKYSHEIGVFIDKKHQKHLNSAKSIEQFISLSNAESKIKESAFMEYYKYENIKKFKHFLINELKEFSIFTKEWRDSDWRFCINNQHVYIDWGNDYKCESYHSIAYVLTERMIYYNGYDKSKVLMEELGIKWGFGGTVADYIRNSLIAFKPLMLEVIDYLEKL